VSKTCLVRFDNNKYSVNAGAVGRPVEIHAYADRVVIRQGGLVVADHRRSYNRGETIYDPGITYRYSRASRARCAMVHLSETRACQQRWSGCGDGSPDLSRSLHLSLQPYSAASAPSHIC
jgi:Mu transposase, C-terminal domain